MNLEEFFNTINVRNDQLIKIKESMIQLLQELVKDKIIHNQLEIVFKRGKKKDGLIKILTTSDITRRRTNLYKHLLKFKMNLTSLKVFLCRNDVKIVIICTVTGGILQVLSKQYLKSHPEFLKNAPVTKEKHRRPGFLSPRGGALIEISGISIKVVAKVVLNFLAEKGLLAGIVTGGGVVISKIPATAISTYLRDSFPQNLPHLEKKKFILVGGEKIYLDQCDRNLEYLFKILEDETIPFEEKEKVAHSILTKYLNLKTMNGRIAFVLCIVFLLYILSIQNPSGFYILLKNLIKAIKEGKISKAIGRSIIRRLQKKGIAIDPELLEVVNS